jgi:hypothetical protein
MLFVQKLFTKFIQRLFDVITTEYSSAPITRTSLTLLDIWQAFVIVQSNNWIPDLMSSSIPMMIYKIFCIGIAIVAIFSLFNPNLWLAAVVLVINIVLYMYLTFAALWISSPPRASAGMTLFITLTCMSSLWRVSFLLINQYRSSKD